MYKHKQRQQQNQAGFEEKKTNDIDLSGQEASISESVEEESDEGLATEQRR